MTPAGPRSPLIDRDAPNIPLPIGGPVPVRVRRPRARRPLRTRGDTITAAVGAACAVAGVILLVTASPASASLVGGRVVVGQMVLDEVGRGHAGWMRFGGPASLALDERPDGSALGAAAWSTRSGTATGACDLRPQASRLVEECTFTSVMGRLTCVDVLDPASGPVWQRTYADGVRTAIAVAADGAAVPVPFPLGR